MGHPSEGALRAFLDGELQETEEAPVRAHLQGCETCRGVVAAQQEASRRVGQALLLLDRDPGPAEAEARRRLRGYVAGPTGIPAEVPAGVPERARRPVSRWGRIPLPFPGTERGIPLPWAASIALLLTAGAASALPGSPFRQWAAEGWRAVTGSGSRGMGVEAVAPSAEEARDASAGSDPAETGASILAGEGGVELWIRGLPAGADVHVVWVDGDMAGIFAGEGTRYRTEAGRVEAESPPGAVRVELPRGLPHAVVGVDGTVLLRSSGGQVDIPGPVQRRTPMEIVFRPGIS